MARYVYTPLDPETSTIRLMSLLPGSYDEKICVSICTTILSSDQIPEYEALSYAWGPAKHHVKIDITAPPGNSFRSNWLRKNISSHLAVRRNLATALRHLRLKNKPRVLWIDAICVDQRNLEERGHQVERMADIYRHATQVIIWLGPASDDSALAMETIRSLGSRIEVDWETHVSRPRSHEDIEWANEEIGLPYDIRTWESVYGLIVRPWFKRLWVWQEAILAKKTEMHCGYETLDWGFFGTALWCILHKWDTSDLPEKIVTDFGHHLWRIHNMFKYQTRTGNTFTRLLLETENCECLDSKDRIYALLNLSYSSEGIIGLKPNYSQTPQACFQEAVLHCLSQKRELHLIAYCEWQGDSPKNPTWVPDLSKPRVTRPIRIARACSGFEAVAEYVGDKILKVTGLLGLGKISRIDEDMLDNKAVQFSYVTRSIQRIAENVGLDLPYLDGSEMTEALCRTLCADNFSESFIPATASFPNTETSLKYVQSMLESPLQQIKPYFSYLNQVWAYMKGRSFFTTKEGHIGLGPMVVKEGDQLCVVLGCESPVILRDSQNGRYAVIGECYVHGLMNGEALFGPLPCHWQNAVIVDNEGSWDGFINQETGKTSFEDPRMGPLPSGLKLEDEEGEFSPRNYFVNNDTGEKWGPPWDPRKTPEALRDRGVPLQEILLE